VPHLISNIPHFKCWVRREFTHNHEKYQDEYIHALAIAVNTIPDRSLSFQVVFTGEEANCDDWDEGNIHGGAMWARMPIQGLVAQHKQSHVLYITEDCEWKGNLIALPNNRVRATSPALWVTGEGPPDFKPSQWAHSAEGHESYLDPSITFNNLYEK
jgi:hypothetical protein